MTIGIDLGTTNCALAHDCNGVIEVVQIEQQIDKDLVAKQRVLPSFLFCSPEGESIVGLYARECASEVPDRVISSAKSWLCHDGIDRREPFLPLGECEQKWSPLQACSAYLAHLKKAYGDFAQKEVIVTVPASFDPSARQLVEEAAALASFPQTVLIEEPLAAFYDWIHRHQENWRDHLRIGDLVLVVDIGGGTTDFSLIRIHDKDGNLDLERIAVGEHLLLGGDNIDLALAHFAKGKLGALDAWQMRALVHSARAAKEQLLSGKEEVSITIPGRGSSLIGGMLKTTLTLQECETFLVNGFFPLVPFDEPVKKGQRMGLTTLALPYVQDPRITAHLASFLVEMPTAVLFNGGTMKSKLFQKRVAEQLTAWRGQPISILPDADLDEAVCRGAAYYGRVRLGEGIRVRTPSARSYYIGVEGSAPAVPGLPPMIRPICIVPFGMEEGSERQLEEIFTLRLGESALFRFFSHPKSNEVTSIDKLTELHPIETLLESEKKSFASVKLSAKLTEVGTLQLWCSSESHRWKPEFNVRN